MDKEKVWNNEEEKNAYFLERKKRTKWFVISFIIIVIVVVILFVFFLVTLLNNSSKEIQGVWDCENGKIVLVIDKNELSLYEAGNENRTSGNYSVIHYSSSANKIKRKDWTIQLKSHHASNDTFYLSTDSRYQDQLFVEVASTNEQYTCERR